MFDLAVNGGGLLTVELRQAAGYPAGPAPGASALAGLCLAAGRRADPAGPPGHSHRSEGRPAGAGGAGQCGRPTADGTRQATLLFPQGTQASWCCPTAATQAAHYPQRARHRVHGGHPRPQGHAGRAAADQRLHLRGGVQRRRGAGGRGHGRALQPAGVPSTWRTSWASRWAWLVPVGYYDRGQGRMDRRRANGRVVKILSVTTGWPTWTPTATARLTMPRPWRLGITDAERQQLAALYDPGQSLWRVPITHFSALGLQLALSGRRATRVGLTGERRSEQPSNPRTVPTEDVGSIIGCQTQTLGEAVNVAGTPFSLHYQSDRTPGRVNAYTWRSRSAARVCREPEAHRSGDPRGRAAHSHRASRPRQPDHHLHLGRQGRLRPHLQGAQPVTVRVGFVYDGDYLAGTPGPELPPAFDHRRADQHGRSPC